MGAKRGFTLIELLVVIAIIAVLAAILFPVFSKVREKARQTTCASNEKQIGLGIMQYDEDYDETLPGRDYNSGPTGNIVSWRTMILPYLKSTDVFKCPSNPYNKYTDQNIDGLYISYSVNANNSNGVGGPFGDVTPNGVKLASIPAPSQLIGMVESTVAYDNLDVTNSIVFASNSQNLFAGHTGFSNFLFMDGHVKAYRPLSTLMNDGVQTNLWTLDNSNFSGTDLTNAETVLGFSQNYYQ